MKNIKKELLSFSKYPIIFGVLLMVPFLSAQVGNRREVRKRANGKCEGCGKKTNKKLIVAHIDHTYQHSVENGGTYNDLDNLKAFCTVCEFTHHINHVGKAKQIGMNEQDNLSTVNGLWRQILIEEPDWQIKLLIKKYKHFLLKIYKKLGYDDSELDR